MAKILIIENSEDVLEMITVLLNFYGHEVVGTSRTSHLTSKISSFNPQLVLLDVWLGHECGKGICKQIKAANANLPVILLSTDARLLDGYESCLADDIVEMPFEIMELKAKIDKVLSNKIQVHKKNNMLTDVRPGFPTLIWSA